MAYYSEDELMGIIREQIRRDSDFANQLGNAIQRKDESVWDQIWEAVSRFVDGWELGKALGELVDFVADLLR